MRGTGCGARSATARRVNRSWERGKLLTLYGFEVRVGRFYQENIETASIRMQHLDFQVQNCHPCTAGLTLILQLHQLQHIGALRHELIRPHVPDLSQTLLLQQIA